MALDKSVLLDGPIPGANFTSDTKNYPWHRPPKYTDLDDAIEFSFSHLMDEEKYISFLTMMETGVTILQAADMFTMAGVASGKWTVDFALLLGGPVAHIMWLMCKGYGIEPKLGLETKRKPATIHTMKAIAKPLEIDREKVKKATSMIDEVKIESAAQRLTPEIPEASGFMAGGKV